MDYNNLPGIRATTIKSYFNESLMTARYRETHNYDKPAFVLGRFVHKLLESNGADARGYVRSPFASFRTKEAKEWKTEQEANGFEVLSATDHDKGLEMFEAVQPQVPDELREFIAMGEKEAIVTHGDFKAQIDVLGPTMILDWKTVASVDRFANDAVKYGYLIQAYHYLMCVQKTEDFDKILEMPFFFAAISKEPPFESLFFQVDTDCLRKGREDWIAGYRRYVLSNEAKSWPNRHHNRVEMLTLPEWAIDVEEDVLEDF